MYKRGEIMALKVINGVKYYPVSESMMFNLESCHDKYSVMIYEAQDKGDTARIEELEKLRDESDELCGKASCGRYLSGKDYGRAKEFVAWRICMRDQACAAAGVPNLYDR